MSQDHPLKCYSCDKPLDPKQAVTSFGHKSFKSHKDCYEEDARFVQSVRENLRRIGHWPI